MPTTVRSVRETKGRSDREEGSCRQRGARAPAARALQARVPVEPADQGGARQVRAAVRGGLQRREGRRGTGGEARALQAPVSEHGEGQA